MKKTHSYKRGKCIGHKVNAEKEKEDRYSFALWYLTYHIKGIKFIFIDEQSYNIERGTYYGWEEKGKPLVIPRKVRLQHSLSLISAITENGLLCFKIFRGILKTEDFSGFLLSCIKLL